MPAHTHTLVAIYEGSGTIYDTTEVVRWCKVCGAVVIDVDMDGRTNPGGVRPMLFPTNSHILLPH